MRVIRKASFALRVVQRSGGKAAIVYRRKADEEGRDRLQRVAALSPLAFTAATPLMREAISRFEPTQSKDENLGDASQDKRLDPRSLSIGAFHPLDVDWGARVACFAILASGLREAERLALAANHLRGADGDEAAWWLGLLNRPDNVRVLRALRILTEAVE